MNATDKVKQVHRVIDYMEMHGSITQHEASVHLSVARLASRINDIKKMGYEVKKEMVSSKNQFNEPVRFARYSLEGSTRE